MSIAVNGGTARVHLNDPWSGGLNLFNFFSQGVVDAEQRDLFYLRFHAEFSVIYFEASLARYLACCHKGIRYQKRSFESCVIPAVTDDLHLKSDTLGVISHLPKRQAVLVVQLSEI